MANIRIPVAASAINLTKSLIDFVPASGTLIQASRETYNWLQRERVDEGPFERCKELTRGLAYPNEAFEAIQRQLHNADRRIADAKIKAPIQLRISGSLGRLLAADPELCYVVSTVTALTKFHGTRITTEMLTYMILDKGGHASGIAMHYDVQRAPLRAVLSKIVESIFLNVVNAGHDLGGLPMELAGLCRHLVSPNVFAGIVMGIQRSDHDVVIRSRRFIADVALWILTHFHGKFEVSVGDAVIFEKQLGPHPRLILLMVQEHCPSEPHGDHATVYADFSIGDTLKPFLAGTDQGGLRPTDHTRQPLYKDIADRHTTYSAQGHVYIRQENLSVLNKQETLSVQNVAKRMVGWLLDLTIFPSGNTSVLAFKVTLDDQATKKSIGSSRRTLGSLLPRYPKIMHMNTGMLDPTPAVLRLPEGSCWGRIGEQQHSPQYSRRGEISTLVPFSVITCFPVAQDLLERIQPRCTCPVCQHGEDLQNCSDGCLRYAAVALLFALIAHAMCDASGVDDVSGGAGKSDRGPIQAAGGLLYSIIAFQDLRWNDWFDVLVQTAAGYSYDRRGTPESSLALQYGSYVMAAPWADIAAPVSVAGCFGVKVFDGGIRGLPDDIGLVLSEGQFSLGPTRSRNHAHSGSDASVLDHPDYRYVFELDTVRAESYTAIFRSTDFTYRLMTTVRAGNRLQIVDPASSVMRLAHCVSPTCRHDPGGVPETKPNGGFRVEDFDQAMITWKEAEADEVQAGPIMYSRTIDTDLKLNTLVSLTPHGCIIRDAGRCCLTCALRLLIERRSEQCQIVSTALISL